jgi:hypothetical protein
MTQAKAQTVASALIGLGLTVQVNHDGTEYTITVASDTLSDIASIQAFATAQSVTAKSQHVVLS